MPLPQVYGGLRVCGNDRTFLVCLNCQRNGKHLSIRGRRVHATEVRLYGLELLPAEAL